MTTVTEERGKQNMYATEPRMYIDPIIQEKQMKDNYETHNERAEKLNGRAAMIGFVAALGAYLTTGQILPGVF